MTSAPDRPDGTASTLTRHVVDELHDAAGDLLADAVVLRRTLHEWPELGNHLPRTREAVLAALEGLPLDITLHQTTSGLAAVLEGDRPGPTVLLRGDMDALPMPEDTGLDFTSRVDQCMHACGHDTHTAMLVGAARLLSARRPQLAGRVLFMFQPGEEGHHGAQYMLEEGLLDLPQRRDGSPSPLSAAYALHITSSLPSGWLGTRPGPVMASSDELRIVVTGAGGHASEPHRARDPIPVACEIVQALQTMVTRRIDVFDPTVVTIGRITAGTAYNVIPETADIVGTIRAVSERTRAKVHDGVRRVAEGIAAAHDVSVQVEITHGYPVTVNDVRQAQRALDVARATVAGRGRVAELPNPVMGAEDFSYVLQRIPGVMMFLGGTPLDKDPSTAAPNHSNRVVFDEQAMATGIATYAALAWDHLGVR